MALPPFPTQLTEFDDEPNVDPPLNAADGTPNDDWTQGLGGDDSLRGAGGNDLLEGGEGDDSLRGEAGADTLVGGNGFDQINYNGSPAGVTVDLQAGTAFGGDAAGDRFSGIEAVFGSSFNDSLLAADAGSRLSGRAGDDTLIGRDGADTLSASSGNDSLAGAGGDDLLVLFQGSATVDGGAGTDTLDVFNNGGGATISLDDDALDGVVLGSGTLLDFGGATEALVLRDIENVVGTDGADVLLGSDTGNLLNGIVGADRLEGRGGDDTLESLGGGASLFGGDGNDVLRFVQPPFGQNYISAGAGDDTLEAVAGRYRLTKVDQGFTFEALSENFGAPPLGSVFIDEADGELENIAVRGGLFSPNGLFVGDSVVLFVCFAAGTRIATPGGETPIEALQPGDLVLTADGAAEPVLFLGRRHIVLAGHPQAAEMAPVCITAGALGDGLPRRDLVVSPDHCLFLDGALVPARLLVNGTTITRDRRRAEVTWFHVELPRHAVILAEGAPAESWLDTGNRAWFENAPVPLLRVAGNLDATGTGWDATRACAPLVHGGPRLAAIRARLGACAAGTEAQPSAA